MPRPVASLLALTLSACDVEHGLRRTDLGDSPTPIIELSPTSLYFEPLEEGEVATDVVTISNVGDAALQVSGLSVPGSTAFAFESWTGSVDPGESVDVELSFSPTDRMDRAWGVISNNDPANPEKRLELVGEGKVPSLAFDPSPALFGFVDPGDSTTLEVYVLNRGNGDLTLSDLVLVGTDFSFVEPELPVVLAPGERLPVQVSFAPTALLAFEGELWATSDAAGGLTSDKLWGWTEGGSITGRVCSPSGGDWIVGADVSTEVDIDGDGTTDWVVITQTDADGWFTLENLPAGTYEVVVEKGSYSAVQEVELRGGSLELAEGVCLDPGSVEVAVVTGVFDSIETLIGELGLEYDTWGPDDYLDLLSDSELLAGYDIVFFDCGMEFDWLDDEELVATNLQNYVAAGGSVYASDWAHYIVEATWPSSIDFHGTDELRDNPFGMMNGTLTWTEQMPWAGDVGTVEAGVADPIMATALGSDTAQIEYNYDYWVVPVARGPGTEVMLRGDVPLVYPGGDVGRVPLAMKFQRDGGTVIFTSFHNEAQITGDMAVALQEIILAL